MNVICEGPDGGGKSTLAQAIADATSLNLCLGAGPPRGPGEIEARLRGYLELDHRVFDRHPGVSQVIYGQLRGEPSSPEFDALVRRLYGTHPLVIYCRSTSPDRHVVKPGENPDHVRRLTEGYAQLVDAYDRWAAERAHLIYRIGDDPLAIVDLVRYVCRRDYSRMAP